MQNLDAVYNEIRELRKDMQSLSPKLEAYQKILKRYRELQKIVGGQGEVPGNRKDKKLRIGHRY